MLGKSAHSNKEQNHIVVVGAAYTAARSRSNTGFLVARVPILDATLIDSRI